MSSSLSPPLIVETETLMNERKRGTLIPGITTTFDFSVFVDGTIHVDASLETSVVTCSSPDLGA